MNENRGCATCSRLCADQVYPLADELTRDVAELYSIQSDGVIVAAYQCTRCGQTFFATVVEGIAFWRPAPPFSGCAGPAELD